MVVVVTRWYGGIKLGAGGLMRAYGGTAAECLRMASRRALVTVRVFELHCRFDDLGVVHAALMCFTPRNSTSVSMQLVPCWTSAYQLINFSA